MASYIDATGRVHAWPLQGRTNSAGVEQVGEHFDGKDAFMVLGMFTGGVASPANAFHVSENTGTDMNVVVGSGTVGDFAIVEGTATLQGNYGVVWPDATTTILVNAANPTNPRYTSIFLVVADVTYDSNGSALVLARLAHVDGTAEATPSPPAYDGSETAVLRLADVFVGAGVTQITDADITDERVFSGVTLAGLERLGVTATGGTVIDTESGSAGMLFRQGGITTMSLNSASQLHMSGNDIVSVGTVDGVDVSAHAARHAPGGGDAIDITDFEVDNSTEVASQALTGSFASVASVSLSIPASWGSWKCEAWASYVIDVDTSERSYETVLRIDGADQQVKAFNTVAANVTEDGAVGGRRTGMATTGARTVALRARETAGAAILRDIYLYARAVRTS